MPKHMRWPRSCAECGCADVCPKATIVSVTDGVIHVSRRDFEVHPLCPIVARDECNDIDWRANGWPEPTPFYGCVDTSNMPQSINDLWIERCEVAEQQFEQYLY